MLLGRKSILGVVVVTIELLLISKHSVVYKNLDFGYVFIEN